MTSTTTTTTTTSPNNPKWTNPPSAPSIKPAQPTDGTPHPLLCLGIVYGALQPPTTGIYISEKQARKHNGYTCITHSDTPYIALKDRPSLINPHVLDETDSDDDNGSKDRQGQEQRQRVRSPHREPECIKGHGADYPRSARAGRALRDRDYLYASGGWCA
ncbi:hypothetical protein BJX76DRAFT_354276 [Aspergillus varians]